MDFDELFRISNEAANVSDVLDDLDLFPLKESWDCIVPDQRKEDILNLDNDDDDDGAVQEMEVDEKPRRTRSVFEEDAEADTVMLQCAQANWLKQRQQGKVNLRMKEVHADFVARMRAKRGNAAALEVTKDAVNNRFKKKFGSKNAPFRSKWEEWKRSMGAAVKSRALKKVQKEGARAEEVAEATVESLAQMIEFVNRKRNERRGLDEDDTNAVVKMMAALDTKRVLESGIDEEEPVYAGRAYWMACQDKTALVPGRVCAVLLSDEFGVIASASSPTKGDDDKFLCWAVVVPRNQTALERGDLRRDNNKSESVLVALAGAVNLHEEEKDIYGKERGQLLWKENRLLGVSLGSGRAFVWMSAEDGNLLRIGMLKACL